MSEDNSNRFRVGAFYVFISMSATESREATTLNIKRNQTIVALLGTISTRMSFNDDKTMRDS